MAATDSPLRALAESRSRWFQHLAEFVSIPSVSSERRHADDVRRAATWLRSCVRDAGIRSATLIETAGAPLVWGEWAVSSRAPTVLMYGHYDVVSPGDERSWSSPPFVPVTREGFMYGRGASDDKGPLLTQLSAVQAWARAYGQPPVNILCLYEGEEEVGSPHLQRLLRAGRLPPHAAGPVDAVLVCDTRMLAARRPALIVGLRGALAAQIEVRGSVRDVHSGAFGGLVANPSNELAALVASLHDRDGRVALDGFYRDVEAPTHAHRNPAAERLVAQQLLSHAGPRLSKGERGFTAYERGALRPSLDVVNLAAGQAGGAGGATIPGRAVAKLSFRLVPSQDPQRVARLLQRHVASRAGTGLTVRTTFSKPAKPVAISPRRAVVRAAEAALLSGFGYPPALLRSGGTIPVVQLFAARVAVPVLMGFARPDDGMHGPNERVDLGALAAGGRSLVHFLSLMSKLGTHARRPAPVGRYTPAHSFADVH
jgi:acetylornithine deacetylase/succinyl-diaminopimelate desuccinylase-like protein